VTSRICWVMPAVVVLLLVQMDCATQTPITGNVTAVFLLHTRMCQPIHGQWK
jgi:hypothetical protein